MYRLPNPIYEFCENVKQDNQLECLCAIAIGLSSWLFGAITESML